MTSQALLKRKKASKQEKEQEKEANLRNKNRPNWSVFLITCEVTLTSDSKYVVDGITKGWAESWKKKGWIKGDKTPALNPDLWDALLTQVARHKVEFVWVRGHAGHPYNERCDQLATAFADSFKA